VSIFPCEGTDKQAEAALNATTTDLKAAYIHFTRAAMILEEIVPGQSDFRTFDKDRYLFIREVRNANAVL